MDPLPPPVAAQVGDESLAPRRSVAERAGEPERAWPGTVLVGERHWVWSSSPPSATGPVADPSTTGPVADPSTAEAVALTWLEGRFPCPRVVWADDGWLVTTAPGGQPADEPEHQPRPEEVPSLIGAALGRLHDLPAAACPLSRSWSQEVALVATAVERTGLDTARLPAPYDRYQPHQLLDLLDGAFGSGGDEPVVCHGHPVVANWLFDGGGLSAIVGVHRLARADRHLDLAVAYRSLQRHFGPESVYGFIEAYGRDPDLVRLDRYVMLDVVREAVAETGQPPQ